MLFKKICQKFFMVNQIYMQVKILLRYLITWIFMGIMVTVNHHGGLLDLFFVRIIESSLKLTKDIQNFIELKKIKGINLRIVEGRNKGIIKQKGLK